MKERADGRRKKMQQIEEERRLRQAEQRAREESCQKEAAEQQRHQQVQALKEAQKLRKEQEERRLRKREKEMELELRAERFYKRYLFRRYALEPLSVLVEERNDYLNKAKRYYEESLLIKIFSAWKREWVERQRALILLADKFYRHSLLWFAFDRWRLCTVDMKQKHQVAVDFHELKVQCKCLRAWYSSFVTMKAVQFEKEIKAVKYHDKRVKSLYFNLWKKYLLLADEIKEKEQRRDEWRDLIKKFIPDASKSRLSLDS